MKVGIFKVSTTYELTIIKTLESGSKSGICVSYTLNPRLPLTDCQAKIKALNLDELWVTVQGHVILGQDSDHDVLNRFSKISSGEKVSVINSEDLNKIKFMAESLGIETLKIFDMYDIFGKMGEEKPVLLCGDYYDDSYAYIYVKNGEIQDHRVWRSTDTELLYNMMKEFDTNFVLPIYNNLLNKPISKKVTNWDYVGSQEKTLLSLSMGSLLVNPVKIFKLVDNHMVEQKIEEPKKTQQAKPVENKLSPKRGPKHVNATKSEKPKKETSLKDKLAKTSFNKTKVLTVSGLMIAMLLGAFLVANKQLPSNIEYLEDKQQELMDLITPKQSTLDYYTKFVEANKAQEGNIDANILAQINGVQVDGLIAEVRLQKDNVGLVVFLKDAKKINELTDKLNSIFEVVQVADKGSVSLDNTSLTKFIINGVR